MNTRTPRTSTGGVRSYRAPGTLLGALLALATGCDESPFAMIQSHLVTSEPMPQSGYSCSQLSGSGSASNGSATDSFWITESQDAEGVVVEWGEGDAVLGKREFPAEFFVARRMERFVIEAPNGDRFSYTVWGADSCTRCPEHPFTPLPGDEFGCGSTVDAGGGAVADETAAARGEDGEGKVRARQ